MTSKIADISNLGDRCGGAITAVLFLLEFFSKKKPFAHIDIAGPVWDNMIGKVLHMAQSWFPNGSKDKGIIIIGAKLGVKIV